MKLVNVSFVSIILCISLLCISVCIIFIMILVCSLCRFSVFCCSVLSQTSFFSLCPSCFTTNFTHTRTHSHSLAQVYHCAPHIETCLIDIDPSASPQYEPLEPLLCACTRSCVAVRVVSHTNLWHVYRFGSTPSQYTGLVKLAHQPRLIDLLGDRLVVLSVASGAALSVYSVEAVATPRLLRHRALVPPESRVRGFCVACAVRRTRLL